LAHLCAGVLVDRLPRPYGQIMRDLAIPFWFVGLGIVLRGAGFAFRKFAPDLRSARLAGVVFASSSLLTPFFLGAIAGAIASGRVGTDEADRADDPELSATMRRRSLAVGALTGVIALAGVFPLRSDAAALFDGLTGRALPLIVISSIAGLLTLWFTYNNEFRRARPAAVIAVAAVVIGWGVGQYPLDSGRSDRNRRRRRPSRNVDCVARRLRSCRGHRRASTCPALPTR
jgi:cytochrome d ubiquinol oxidase subunit II